MSNTLSLADAAATDVLGGALASAMCAHWARIRAQGLQLDLCGDLGAGKSALVRATLRGLGVSGAIKSPTFALLEPYTVSSLDFYHFDFYRLKNPAEFGTLGFRELFGSGRICAVEWPERAGARLPTADISIALSIDGEGRLATINTASELGNECLCSVMEDMHRAGGASLPPVPARSLLR